MVKRDKNGFPFEYLSDSNGFSDAKESFPVHPNERPKSGGTLTQQIQILALLTLLLVLLLIMILLAARSVSLNRHNSVPVNTMISIESLQINVE